MKILIRQKSSDIFSMSKLREDLASAEIAPNIPNFVYFSEALAGHSPRIKFYGGTKETSNTNDCPSMLISKESGAGNVELLPWQNRKNCSNAYNKAVLTRVSKFINSNLSLLLLTWFRKLDETHTLHYFEGSLSWKDLLSKTENLPERIKTALVKCKDNTELHQFCLDNDLYKF